MFAKRLSADDTSRVRVYEDNPSKLGSRLDTRPVSCLFEQI